jgi:hypothetical protein
VVVSDLANRAHQVVLQTECETLPGRSRSEWRAAMPTR